MIKRAIVEIISKMKVNKLNLTLFVSITLSFSVLIVGIGKAQASKFWIDHMIDNCVEKSRAGSNSVLAYASTGTTWCSWNFSSLSKAKRVALAKCRSRVPSKYRSSAPCKIIWVNGEIVDIQSVQLHRTTHKFPIKIKIFDAKTKSIQDTKGNLIVGKYSNRFARPVKLELMDGSTLCKGFYSYEKRSIGFRLTCFGKFEFREPGTRILGYKRRDDLHVALFNAKLESGDSYIEFMYDW